MRLVLVKIVVIVPSFVGINYDGMIVIGH